MRRLIVQATVGLPMRDARGSVLINMLVGIPLALIAALILTFTFYEGRKAYWDWRVEQMCEKDGGVKIIERVALTPEQARLMPRGNGHISVSVKNLAGPTEPVFVVVEDVYIRNSNPEVRRGQSNVVRRHDEKTVATVVRYSRVGGDPPLLPVHPSYFTCPDIDRNLENLAKLFIVKESTK